ncbi:Uncharacterised protein [BD1-7 clade bacterium]|uniref:Uncharacterized protein n=1 Tax=BD1-7 clade bacterium TaxID=2029982 RepID=A0A5S9QIG7_9GAMM|nr:Uncharacterised protein [BD1-7 clade bacterium]CAA0118015.1 Uncharacterised protein [BD1-7 clade bacterium]
MADERNELEGVVSSISRCCDAAIIANESKEYESLSRALAYQRDEINMLKLLIDKME